MVHKKNKNTGKHHGSRFTYAFEQSLWNDWAKGHTECNQEGYLASWVLVTSMEVFFHKVLRKQSYSYLGCSSFDVSSASSCFKSPWDKWEGVPLVGDSSAQWELSTITTSVCLRYGLFVVLPTTNSFIITHKKYGWERNVFFVIIHHTTSPLLKVLALVI